MSIRIINGKVYKNGAFSEEEIVLKEGKSFLLKMEMQKKSMMQRKLCSTGVYRCTYSWWRRGRCECG